MDNSSEHPNFPENSDAGVNIDDGHATSSFWEQSKRTMRCESSQQRTLDSDRPNYFISLRIDRPTVVLHLKEYQEQLVEKLPALKDQLIPEQGI